jgi:hypothetical protein
MSNVNDWTRPTLIAVEGNTITCNMPHRVMEWSEVDGIEAFGGDVSVCGADVFLTYTATLDPIGPGTVIPDSEFGQRGLATHWQVECQNGHVLAVSSESANGNDYAEDFDFDKVFPSFRGIN